MSDDRPPSMTVREIIEGYDTLLIDAYGVLVHSSGCLEGAERFIGELHRRDKPYFIVTNDASRLPSTLARSLEERGLAIEEERLITSGSLLTDHFRQKGLEGARCLVLGPQDSKSYVELARGEVVALDDGGPVDVIVVADDAGFPYLEGVEKALNLMIQAHEGGQNLELILPNPDLIYPSGEKLFGLASGSIALVLEEAMRLRFPGEKIEFDRLGKPYTPLFEEAARRAGHRDMVMLGDQLRTDIRGANAFGIDSALVLTGLSRWQDGLHDEGLRPTFLVENLDLD